MIPNWARALQNALAMLRPGGRLGLMTQPVISRERFKTWHYPADPTHVCFYSKPVFEWLAAHFNLRREQPAPSVVLFQKKGTCHKTGA
jgi:hypothetical protein